ncbi:Carbohydrate-binding module family 19 domain-containing protein [Madurella fahalii]|uniref:Carbohydrate-binding module family 19 domain-containing protein n=1 Tax=Madurella fahalii TaxID=1157608 RepID=A0ABQ0GN48_9PEZI
MKYATALLALAAGAIAHPSEKRTGTECTFGTYRCTTPNSGIEICNIQGKWELVGPCPEGTSCEDLPQNGFTLPFCTKPKVEARNGRPGQSPGEPCSTPGKYQCFGPYAIQVCDTQNVLQFVGDCPNGSHCDYLNGIPYCVANY